MAPSAAYMNRMTDTVLDGQACLETVLQRCLAKGATAADVALGVSRGIGVEVRGGKLESVERSESQGISLRCFDGQRQAHVSGSDLSEAGLEALADRCVMMARAVPEDPYCGLADPAELATDALDLDIDGDPEPALEQLEADALEAEAAALSVPGVKQVSSCGNSWSQSERWLAASNGFRAYRKSGSTGLGLAAVAERDGAMERDYESRSCRRLEDRPSAVDIGRVAGERTIARLGPKQVKTQKAAVIFDRRLSASLLGPLLGAISGPSIARGVSFLKDRLGDQIFAPDIQIIDDPFRRRGMGSRLHDGEGRPVSRRHVVEDGVLSEWLLNGSSARQLGLKPNGYAQGGFGSPPGVGVSNLFLAAGTQSPAELMADAGKGLLVSDMFGPSINPNTGDYSVGVAGFWFEQGELQHPVSEVTIASDLQTMFASLKAANDLEFRGTRDAPSLLIEGMSIAGD